MDHKAILDVGGRIGLILQELKTNEVCVVLGAMAQQAMRGHNDEQRHRFITQLLEYAEYKTTTHKKVSWTSSRGDYNEDPF